MSLSFVQGNFSFDVGGYQVTVSKNAVICVAITAVVLTTIFVLLRFSKWGLSVRATASNEYVAGMLGVNTHVVTAATWAIAGALGALAACINTMGTAQIGVYFMTDYQVTAFLAGIVGGFATFYGPVIVAGCIPLLTSLIGWFSNGVLETPEVAKWSTVIVYVIALIIVFFKPSGIFGKKVEKKV